MRVCVLGTGIMGAPMARNLATAGLQVSAWNRTRAKAEPLGEHGVAVTSSPSEAVAGADAVVTMLTHGEAVREVMRDGGALAAMGDDALWLQTSTVGLAACEELAALAAERGVTFVDCPVLGTRQPAEQAQLVVLAGGPDEAHEPAAPVFEAIGSKTLWLGPAGAGTRMKLVLNGWLLALVAALGETVSLARALDVDPRRFLEIIDGSAIGMPYAQLKGGAMIEEKFEPPAFPLSLALKDARLVLEAADAAELELPLAEAMTGLLESARDAGHGDEDMAAVYYASARGRARA